MTTGTGRADDDALIRTLKAEMADAIRAKDSARVVSFFGGEPTMFVLAPPNNGMHPNANRVSYVY